MQQINQIKLISKNSQACSPNTKFSINALTRVSITRCFSLGVRVPKGKHMLVEMRYLFLHICTFNCMKQNNIQQIKCFSTLPSYPVKLFPVGGKQIGVSILDSGTSPSSCSIAMSLLKLPPVPYPLCRYIFLIFLVIVLVSQLLDLSWSKRTAVIFSREKL